MKLLHSSWGKALAAAVATGALMAALAGVDYANYAGRPVEHGVVTEIRKTGGRIDCGRPLVPNTDEMAVTYAVDTPPAGLPSTFTTTGCPPDERVGDVVPLVRTGPDPEQVYIYPFTSAWDVVVFAIPFAVVAFAVVLLALFVAGRVRARLGRSPNE
jgi:hypothetical protein